MPYRSFDLLRAARGTLFLLCAAAAALPAVGQQAEPAPTGARAAASADFLDHFTWHPGGTREAEMWQVLVLFGIGDPDGKSWDGSLSIHGGEILAMDPHRLEPPDRILPQGGWRLRTQNVRILQRSTVVPRPEPAYREAVLPKGIWIRGSGNATTTVDVATAQGDFTFRPMAMEFGPWTKALAGRVAIQRTLPATDPVGHGAAPARFAGDRRGYRRQSLRHLVQLSRPSRGTEFPPLSRGPLVPADSGREGLRKISGARRLRSTGRADHGWFTRNVLRPTGPAIGTSTPWHGKTTSGGDSIA